MGSQEDNLKTVVLPLSLWKDTLRNSTKEHYRSWLSNKKWTFNSQWQRQKSDPRWPTSGRCWPQVNISIKIYQNISFHIKLIFMIWQDNTINYDGLHIKASWSPNSTFFVVLIQHIYKCKIQQKKTCSRIIFYQRIMIIEAILTQLNPQKGSLVFNNWQHLIIYAIFWQLLWMSYGHCTLLTGWSPLDFLHIL